MLSRRSQQQQQRGVGVGDVPSARVLVVGEAGVGKSALVRALLALEPPRARERAAGGEPREREEAPVRTVILTYGSEVPLLSAAARPRAI